MSTTGPAKRLWTVEDLSAYLGIPVPTIRGWRAKGTALQCGRSASTCATTQ